MNYVFHIARSPLQNGHAGGGASGAAQSFQVAMEERMTVLDGLFKIQHEMDPTLAFRCSCRVGMCGTCAVLVNRIPRLACSTRLQNLGGANVTIAPLPHLPVVKDLVVSLDPFFEQWKRVLPALRPDKPDCRELLRVRPDSEFGRAAAGKRDCITCGICFAACGITRSNRGYLGPAAMNKGLLRALDPRDSAAAERMAVMNDDRGGAWRCHTQFNCTAACPKGIGLTDSIVRIKRSLLWHPIRSR